MNIVYLESLITNPLVFKTKLLSWQAAGLSYTASGYGTKIPTNQMVQAFGRWYRVYADCYSNVASCYIVRNGGKLYV